MDKPVMTNARIRALAHGPDYDPRQPGTCAHNLVRTEDKNGNTIWVCTRPGCGYTIR